MVKFVEKLFCILMCCVILVTILFYKGLCGRIRTQGARGNSIYTPLDLHRHEKKRTASVDVQPAIIDNSVHVLLLSYQRCGSTFTGGLFNTNEKAFYMFEPVDGIYSSMYGSWYGFNVPSDINNLWNGTKRHLPDYEVERVAEETTNLLTCNLKYASKEILGHRFLFLFKKQHLGIYPYIECLQYHNTTSTTQLECWKQMKGVCVDRFGSSIDKQEKCLVGLNPGVQKQNRKLSSDEMTKIANYKRCMKETAEVVDACLPLLENACTISDIRSVKTVRLGMRSAELMLHKLPNLKIIHLIRDPRGVALSRMKDSTYHAKKSSGDYIQEAKFYCENVLSDIEIKNRIESQHPGSTFQVVYEKLSQDPISTAQEMYRFLNKPLPVDVDVWLRKSTGLDKHSKKSVKIATSWQNRLSMNISASIVNACAKLYDQVNFNISL